jgi:Protein of unknown function (DUF2909)
VTRLLILVGFLAIVLSLGSATVLLVRGKGDSNKLARALMIRLGLSILLFVLLLVAYWLGWIQPKGS